MTQILSIQSSGRHDGSISRQLSVDVLERLGGEVTERDLTTSVPHVDAAWIGANFTSVDQRTAAQSATLAYSDGLVEEVMDADVLVIGVPIYNFGVPAALKAWFDMVARVGVTFKYTDTGPVGMLNGKRAIFVVASGGTPVGSDIDFATPWLRQAMRFIGIDDVTIIAADALAQNPEDKLRAARKSIQTIKV